MAKKIGKSKKQEVDGLPKIVYGWIDKNDINKFYSIIGAHSKIKVSIGDTFIDKCYNRIKRDVRGIIDELFTSDYTIVDVDIPGTIVKGKGYIKVEVMIHSVDDITSDDIEIMNMYIVEKLKSYSFMDVYPTRKDLSAE